MQRYFKIRVVLEILFVGGIVQAQEKQASDTKWGFEVELIQPFIPTVEIFNLQATKTIFATNSGQKSDLVLGAYLRPKVEHDVVEKIDEYMLYTAYRHYFWEGLHAEAGVNTGYYYGTKNLVDGKDYDGLGLFWEANIGYKLNIGKKKRFYMIGQFGGLGNIKADIGPRGGKPDNFIQGNLFIGINF